MKIKYINVECPALVNFYCNRENGNLITVNDTVDLCDEVEVSVDNRYDISRIYLNNKLLLGDNLIKNAINAFFEYTNISRDSIVVRVNKQIPEQVYMEEFDNIASGVILALNTYYQLELSKEELIQIASMVSNRLTLFIYGGYHQVYNYGEKIIELKENRYDNYLMVLSNLKEKWISLIDLNCISSNNIKYTSQFYNCLECMAPSELVDLKERLLELKADNVCINGTSNSVVACFNDRHNRFIAREELKKEKIKTILCRPVDGIKVSRRYK